MHNERREGWEEQWYIWALVALAVLVAVIWLAFATSRGPAPGSIGEGKVSIATSPQTLPHHEKLTELEKYNEWIKRHQPVVTHVKRKDLVDGSEADVPSVDMQNNYVGGEATDMFAVTMSMDERDPRRPVPGRQEWELKTFTFPKSRATYMEIDLLPTGQQGIDDPTGNMQDWDVAALCPPLARIDQATWTQDERQYVHCLTRRTMGMSDTEVGFAALWAAYASNFALWKGQERSVPAAAYYALAAAHFEADLAAKGPPTKRAAAVTWLVCGECYRLLGALEDALRCYGEAQRLADELEAEAAVEAAKTDPNLRVKIDIVRPVELQVLELCRGLAEDGDTYLHRQPFTGVPEPPIGWFVEQMLPAINGDLDVERGTWKQLRSTEDICNSINALIQERRAGH